MNGELQQRVKRILIQEDVIVNTVVKAEALDISSKGMYIYTQSSFVVGTICEISFKIGNDIIKTMVQVQHAQPNVGFGVKFIDLSETDSLKVRKYIGE
ncbi:MAG: PilZ domain-containing protein [Nitrospirae bacterium]|nr:PilZ domain-containing protein [Nitrospirota bacterium]